MLLYLYIVNPFVYALSFIWPNMLGNAKFLHKRLNVKCWDFIFF